MTWLIPIIQGNKQAKAITQASTVQSNADQAAIDEQRRQFDTTRSDLQPWMNAGQAALGQIMNLLGLGGGATGGAAGTPGTAGPPGGVDYARVLQDRPDVAAQYQSESTRDAKSQANLQALGIHSPADYAKWWLQNKPAEDTYQPPTTAGTPGAPGTPGATGAPVDAAGAQQGAIDQLKASPLYQSLYRNGSDTILQNASATGGLRGGNIQHSLANFGSDTLASVIQQQLANLSGISGQGATTGTNVGQLGAGAAANIGNITIGQGADRAGGILGSTQAKVAGQNDSLKQLTDALAAVAKGF